MFDIWSGLANFLAEIIEKYGGELNLDRIPNFTVHKQSGKKRSMLKEYRDRFIKARRK